MLVVRPLEQLVRLGEAPDPRLEDRLRWGTIPEVLGRDALASRQPLGLMKTLLVTAGFHAITLSTTVPRSPVS